MKAPQLTFFAPLLCALSLSACVPAPPPPAYPAQRFVLLRADGQPATPGQGAWQCVWDKQNGLLWQVQDVNESLRSSLSSYSWYDGKQGRPKGGSCAKDEPGMPFVGYVPCDTSELQAALRAQNFCGARDWRLPSVAEWRSLLLQHGYGGETLLPFPLFPGNVWGPYWTSEQGEIQGQHIAQTMHIGTGEAQPLRSASVAYLMLVAGKKD